MPLVKATPKPDRRVRKEDGALLKPEGENVERNSFWLRREIDGDVTLQVTSPEGAGSPPTPQPSPQGEGEQPGAKARK